MRRQPSRWQTAAAMAAGLGWLASPCSPWRAARSGLKMHTLRRRASTLRLFWDVGYPFDCHLASAQVPDQHRWLPGVGRRVREWQ
jgi:hypothetical protein